MAIMFQNELDNASWGTKPNSIKKHGLILAYIEINDQQLKSNIDFLADSFGLTLKVIVNELVQFHHSTVENTQKYEDLTDFLISYSSRAGCKMAIPGYLRQLITDVLIGLDFNILSLIGKRPHHELWSVKEIQGDTIVIERHYDMLVEAHYARERRQEERDNGLSNPVPDYNFR